MQVSHAVSVTKIQENSSRHQGRKPHLIDMHTAESIECLD